MLNRIINTIIGLTIITSGFSQDLFSKKNSEMYAEYLLKSGQFSLGVKEYERLVYFDSSNIDNKTNLLRSYRLSNQISLGLNRAFVLFPQKETIPEKPAIELVKLYLENKEFNEAKNFWINNSYLQNDDKILLNTSLEIFTTKLGEAKTTLTNVENKENPLYLGYSDLLENRSLIKRKSPAAAGIMSGIVPGLGRVYSKNWKDGLVSLLFISGMTVQSVRSFNKHGVNNFRGWIYGGIGLGFYLGNIAGSVKSAKNYNTKQTSKIQHEASSLFNIYF